MSAAFPAHRRRRCDTCPSQCPGFLERTLDLADPAAACPIQRWFPRAVSPPSSVLRPPTPRPARSHRPLRPCASNPAKWGPPLWAEFHTNPLFDIEHLLARIPCTDCRQHFREVLAEFPAPPTNAAVDWFAWTVHVHNAVNRRLGAKEWTIEEARARWRTE